ncbi:MAG: hypothetical protein K6A96_08715 [Prevotella sp.]|nr:hypothetical protein [Prevotella sp.]
MKRILSLTIVLLFSVMAVDAQLKVNSLGKNTNSTGIRDEGGLYQICITKPGYIPYIALAGNNAHLYVQNEQIDNVIHVFTNSTSIGSSVTLEKSPGPVKIERGGGLVINSNNVVIEDDFEVKLGGTLEIR